MVCIQRADIGHCGYHFTCFSDVLAGRGAPIAVTIARGFWGWLHHHGNSKSNLEEITRVVSARRLVDVIDFLAVN
jgi:hypothetical protein